MTSLVSFVEQPDTLCIEQCKYITVWHNEYNTLIIKRVRQMLRFKCYTIIQKLLIVIRNKNNSLDLFNYVTYLLVDIVK